MARLRTVSPSSPGWTRRRSGRGFRYLDEHGAPLPKHEIGRIKALAIPPAWRDVWICKHENGHIQATGTDDAGRRQYLYHPTWREQRDKAKFDRVLAAARRMPRVRREIERDLALEGMPLERACAAAVRLLDLGYFRIGSDLYADANGSYGLTTLLREHVRAAGEQLVFEFVGKSGVEHAIEIDDTAVIAAVQTMRRRRGGERLMAYRDASRGWCELDAAAVNAYLDERFGGGLTAKDFRTWHATVLAAEALARSEEPGTSKASRRRAVRLAVAEVAEYLGNTPAVARGSYIDPRVIDLYEDGKVARLGRRVSDPVRRQAALERAVLKLLA